jgi:hypothetical protein
MANGNPTAPPFADNQGSAGIGDLNNTLKSVVSQLSTANANMLALIATLKAIFPQIFGTFTLAASPTTTVTQPGVQANSVIPTPTPTNAAAAQLMGSAKALYISSLTPGVGFTVATGDGAAAAGTETFQYVVFNPA